jgi:hypothetical protein
MYSARLETGVARCVGHFASGEREQVVEEAMLLLSAGSADAFDALVAASVGPYAIALNMAMRVASHPGGHADPVCVFEAGGRWHVALFLAGESAAGVAGAPLVVVDGDGARTTVAVEVGPVEMARADPLRSSLRKEGAGCWFLDVEAGEPFDIVWQRVVDGRATEATERFGAGRHAVPVPPSFGEYWGACLTTGELVGGFEHKHQFFGHVGQATGRHLLADGALMHPLEDRGAFAYRAAVAVVGPDGRPGGADRPWEGFDEVEAWAPPRLAAAAAAALAGCPVPWRVRTYAAPGDPGGESADLAVLPAGVSDAARPYSWMLFADQSATDFPQTLAAALRAASAAPFPGLFDRPWLEASVGAFSEGAARHGAAFSWPRRQPDAARWLAAERRRRRLPSHPCCGCRAAAACDNLLSFPWGDGAVPPPGAACGLAELLVNTLD